MFSPRIVVKRYGLVKKMAKKSIKDEKMLDNFLGSHNEEKIDDEVKESKNNKKKNKKDMAINEEQISAAEEQASALSNNVKVVKKERGLIERTESSKIILTEDNRQVLND